MEKFTIAPEKLDATIKKKPKEDPVGVFLERFGNELDIKHAVEGEIDFSYLTPAQRAESMWAIFQNIKRSVAKLGGKDVREKMSQDEMDELGMGLGVIKNLYEDKATREIYADNYQRYIQESESINGEFEKFKVLKSKVSKQESALDNYARRIFGKREKINEMDRLLFKTAKKNLSESRLAMNELLESNAELRVLNQSENIKKYAKELHKGGYMWLPSRRDFLEDFEEAALFGRPLLVFGESGTGKTELIRNAALKLTGQIANETPGKDTRFENLIARRGMSADGSTFFEYQSIGEAATGLRTTLDKEKSHKGKIVIDDEFNLLPQAEQIERLSKIASWKPGRKIAMMGKEVEIAPNFLYCASVNLASDKYSGGRSDIPLEVMRKFHKLEVGFIPQTEDNPEIHDGVLAALSDENGRFRASKSEVSPIFEKGKEEARLIEKDGQKIKQYVEKWELKNQEEVNGKMVMAGGFAWRLACAINELNKSIAHKDTVLKHKGEAQYLNKVLIDVGRITEWMKTYVISEYKTSLEQFIMEKIRDQFSEMKSFSQEDRELTKEFFAHFGIDLNSNAEKPAVEFEIMTPRDIGLFSPRVKYEKIVSEEPVLAESYFIDAEGKRVEYRIQPIEKGDKKFVPGQIFKMSDGNYEFLGVDKVNGDPVYVTYKKKKVKSRKENVASTVVKASWKNPETGQEQTIEINLEKIMDEQKAFYRDKLNLEIDEREAMSIWNKNYAEIKSEIEKYGYDEILIVPDGLPEEEVLNQSLIETMEETVSGRKKRVAATYKGNNFESGGSFAGVRNSYTPKYRLVLTHGVQNIEDHPILKATRNKNILQVTGLDATEVDRRISNGEELPVDCKLEINGQKIEIRAEGESLEEYQLQQCMYFDKTGEHLDKKDNSYARLLKSFSGSRVVLSFWSPVARQLYVNAHDPGDADVHLGLRLSRSFSS